MFEKLKETIGEVTKRHANRPFLEAAMATCAYVASADGAVSFSERGRVDDILEHLEQLRVYDPHDGVDLFNDYTDALTADRAKARARVFQAVAKVAKQEESAKLIARMVFAISNADGDFSEDERKAGVEIVEVLKQGGALIG